MVMGQVVGTVVATHKDEKLRGATLQIVQVVDLHLQHKESFLIVVDSVGAGEGEIVLCASGSSARQTASTENRPVDAVIMAIVDSFEVMGEVRFRKK
ncbi:MAG: EutN/CcmL family microcompartment protein [Candidatus Latescibacteria bacterium]|nr:EutN/CcmL family microcompartment protein [Candidatus Latescibacterota bacterium]